MLSLQQDGEANNRLSVPKIWIVLQHNFFAPILYIFETHQDPRTVGSACSIVENLLSTFTVQNQTILLSQQLNMGVRGRWQGLILHPISVYLCILFEI